MQKFRKHYIIAAIILIGVLTLSSIMGISNGDTPIGYSALPIVIILIIITPILRRGGITANPRTAICISMSLATLFLISAITMFIEFSITTGEGPKGEGAPLAFILAMVLFALVFLCPWLLIALRGIRLWNYKNIAEQGAAGNPLPAE